VNCTADPWKALRELAQVGPRNWIGSGTSMACIPFSRGLGVGVGADANGYRGHPVGLAAPTRTRQAEVACEQRLKQRGRGARRVPAARCGRMWQRRGTAGPLCGVAGSGRWPEQLPHSPTPVKSIVDGQQRSQRADCGQRAQVTCRRGDFYPAPSSAAGRLVSKKNRNAGLLGFPGLLASSFE
jgi:hypothetical protein